MTINNGDIENVLWKVLRDVAPRWDTKEIGVEFKPKADRPWQRGTFLPGKPEVVAFGDGAYSRMYAIYQVDLFFPTKDKNIRPLFDRASAVKVLFWPDDCRGSTIQAGESLLYIETAPAISQLIEGDAAHNHIHVDVTIRVDEQPTA